LILELCQLSNLSSKYSTPCRRLQFSDEVQDVDVENFTGAGCCLYARIQFTNYDSVITSIWYYTTSLRLPVPQI